MRHNVFISYHHQNDERYKLEFERLFTNVYDILESRAVSDGDINPYNTTETIRQKIRDEFIRSATVSVVLIGRETWKRKHVDWEISSSLRNTRLNSRTGLLGIILPTYPRRNINRYNQYTIPPRLYDNIQSGYSEIYNWNTNPYTVQTWIHDAFLKRNLNPVNSRDLFQRNRSGDRWF